MGSRLSLRLGEGAGIARQKRKRAVFIVDQAGISWESPGARLAADIYMLQLTHGGEKRQARMVLVP